MFVGGRRTVAAMGKRALRIVWIGSWSLLAAALVGLLWLGRIDGLPWVWRNAAEFLPHGTVALLVCLLALLVARAYRIGSFLLAIILIQVALIFPLRLAWPFPGSATDSFTLQHLNLGAETTNRAAQGAELLFDGADVLTLVEVLGATKNEISFLLYQEYPYRACWDGHAQEPGIEILSRFPIVEADLLRLPAGGSPLPWARLALPNGSEVTILAVHLTSPVSETNLPQRDRELADLREAIANLPRPLLAIGDFNATPWTPGLRQLRREADLHRPGPFWRYTPTFPTATPLLRLPIDLALSSDRVTIRSLRPAPPYGSDHYGIQGTVEVR
jgi:endonuclease/exonuclease/phosphatase (EEP) superfamily protein YafD